MTDDPRSERPSGRSIGDRYFTLRRKSKITMPRYELGPSELVKLDAALTVVELREALEDFPEDALVVFTVPYGDHNNTMQALPVDSVDRMDEREQYIQGSAYSTSGLCIAYFTDEEYRFNSEWGGPDIVILS